MFEMSWYAKLNARKVSLELSCNITIEFLILIISTKLYRSALPHTTFFQIWKCLNWIVLFIAWALCCQSVSFIPWQTCQYSLVWVWVPLVPKPECVVYTGGCQSLELHVQIISDWSLSVSDYSEYYLFELGNDTIHHLCSHTSSVHWCWREGYYSQCKWYIFWDMNIIIYFTFSIQFRMFFPAHSNYWVWDRNPFQQCSFQRTCFKTNTTIFKVLKWF